MILLDDQFAEKEKEINDLFPIADKVRIEKWLKDAPRNPDGYLMQPEKGETEIIYMIRVFVLPNLYAVTLKDLYDDRVIIPALSTMQQAIDFHTLRGEKANVKTTEEN